MKLGPYELGPNRTPESGIYTGDARDLAPALPDASVDLIFTDPVYDRLDDYRWLAETAARVLKPEGACLCWCSNIQQYAVQPAMAAHLRFVAPLRQTYVGKPHRLIAYNLFVWTTPCLWFDRGHSYPRQRTIDTIITHGPPKGAHPWNKNPESVMRWLWDFTDTESVVWDPFTGGGTVPVVCKQLGRRYLAFEIDPDTAASARERVRHAQPPLFVPEAVQATFSDL